MTPRRESAREREAFAKAYFNGFTITERELRIGRTAWDDRGWARKLWSAARCYERRIAREQRGKERGAIEMLDTALAPQPIDASPPASRAEAQPDVEFIVNDSAEFGVRVGNQFFWYYKRSSPLVYRDGKHDDGRPMRWRPVWDSREFGESIHPSHLKTLPETYREGEGWLDLPSSATGGGDATRGSIGADHPKVSCPRGDATWDGVERRAVLRMRWHSRSSHLRSRPPAHAARRHEEAMTGPSHVDHHDALAKALKGEE